MKIGGFCSRARPQADLEVFELLSRFEHLNNNHPSLDY